MLGAKKKYLLLRSANHALVLLTGVLLGAFSWFFYRLPHGNLMIVTCAMLCAASVYDVRDFKDRFRLTVQATFGAGVLQFIFGIFADDKFLLLIAGAFCSYYIMRMIRNHTIACVAVIVGHIGLISPGGFMASADRLIALLLFSLTASIISALLAGMIHSKLNYFPAYPGSYTRSEALKFTLMLLIGNFIMQATTMPESIWIPLTVAFVYYAKDRTPDMDGLLFLRLWGTFAGLFCGFLFMGCLTYFDYKMIYLMPFLGAFGFFILYYTRNYFVYTLFFMMAFCMYDDFITGELANAHLMQMVFSRTFATMLGVLLVKVFEYFHLPGDFDEIKKEEGSGA